VHSQGSDIIALAQRQLDESSHFLSLPELNLINTAFKEFADTNQSLDAVKVVTQPDRTHRSKPQSNPITTWARRNNLDLFQPERIRASIDEYSSFIQSPNETIAIVASYGQILPEGILDAHTYGCINWHPSLLPLYRGPTPMQSLLNQGDANTGLTWIEMEKGMDSGPILLQTHHTIKPEDTFTNLKNSMGKHGVDTWAIALVMQLMSRQGSVIRSIQQDHSAATFTPMLSKNDRRIDPKQSRAEDIINRYRGYLEFPGISFYSSFFGAELRLDGIGFEAKTSVGQVVYEDPELIWNSQSETLLRTKDGCVHLKKVTNLSSGKQINMRGFSFI